MAGQTVIGPEPAPHDSGRNESPEEREDRNLIELLAGAARRRPRGASLVRVPALRCPSPTTSTGSTRISGTSTW